MTDRRRNGRTILIAICLLALAGPVVHATGKLRGSVQDLDGNPLVGVRIEMIPMQDDLPTVKVKSNKKGKFVFGLLRNANYRLLAFHEGMRVVRVDANLAVPEDDSLWTFHEDMAPGTEMPRFSITGVTSVTFDLKFDEYGGEIGDHGTGVPISPTSQIVKLIEDGNLDEADGVIASNLDAKPDWATMHYLQAFLERARGNLDGALAAVEVSIELDPDLEGSLLLRGQILQARGDYEAALVDFGNEAVRSEGRVKRDSYLGAAAICQELERDEQAIENLVELIEIAPDFVEAYKALADLYFKTDQPDKAAEMMTKVSELGVNDPNVLFNLGAERFNAGEFEAARDYFRQTIAAAPEYADAHLQLAYTLLSLSDMEGAAESLTRFIELSPEDSDAAQSARGILQQIKK